MKIFLTGASGFIGKSLFLKLLEKNYDITVCIHKSDLFFDKNINTVYCDYTKDHDIHKWSKRLSGVDIIINTVGIIRETSKQKFEDLHFNAPTAIFKAAEKLKISKIIHISALGVAENRTEKYLSTKYRCDKFLLNLKNKAIILRPSVVIGKEGGIFSFFCGLASLPVIPLIGDGSQKLQPVMIYELNNVILNILEKWPEESVVLNIAGKKEITLSKMLETIRINLRMKNTINLKIPIFFIRFFAKINNYLAFGPLTYENLKILESGNTGNIEKLTSVTDVKVRSFQNGLTLLNIDRDYINKSKLFFIKPLLHFLMPFFWIYNGAYNYFEDYLFSLINIFTGILFFKIKYFKNIILLSMIFMILYKIYLFDINKFVLDLPLMILSFIMIFGI